VEDPVPSFKKTLFGIDYFEVEVKRMALPLACNFIQNN